MNNEEDKNFEDFQEAADVIEAEELQEGTKEAAKTVSHNEYFRQLMDKNFLEYASYVIKDRAIPNVDDGLKPVQRRILWVLHKTDEGGTKKTATIVGDVMGKYHPHGDASIKDALTVLANKEYFIKKQGNFGNIITGDGAAAPRYTECGLTQLARDVLYCDEITPMVETYDSRNLEPIVLPVKIPGLLMLGSDGIAVGMKTTILPHNFNELLKAQIAVLNGETFELYPDFLQGGVVDVSEYADGNGKVTVRAKMELDGRDIIIREIPYATDTEKLMQSIEKASEKGKIKISNINDFTNERVEIRITPTRGQDPNKTMAALYMHTNCSMPISTMMTVIKDNRPCEMSVTEVIHRNTEKLLEYLKAELEIELNRLNELFHAKTLAQIFFENRIYKRIEEVTSEEEEYREVEEGLKPFLHLARRELKKEDIDKLLALPVRRISRFDIEKNQKELQEIDRKIAEINKKLKNLKDYAIAYLNNLLEKYGPQFPRRTEIVHGFEKIDRNKVALNNIRIGWDKKEGYIGTAIKSDEPIVCNEFDHLLLIKKNGWYKIINLPSKNKEFVDKLYECRKYDPAQEFAIIYFDIKAKKYYSKRTCIDKFITDKEYMLCPANCKIEFFTPRVDAIYELIEVNKRGQEKKSEINLMEFILRTPKARGMLLTANTIKKITHVRYLTKEEIEVLQASAVAEALEDIENDKENTEVVENQSIIEENTKKEENTQKSAEPLEAEEVTITFDAVKKSKESVVAIEAAQEIIEKEAKTITETEPSQNSKVEAIEAIPVEKVEEKIIETAIVAEEEKVVEEEKLATSVEVKEEKTQELQPPVEEPFTLQSSDEIEKKKPARRPRIAPKKPAENKPDEDTPPIAQMELFQGAVS